MKKKFNFTEFISSKMFSKIITFLGLFLVSTGVSLGVFSYLIKPGASVTSNVETKRARIDPSLPKTEACPINGEMFSKAERDIWETRRPITAMIENHEESRPQSGLTQADVVYEAVAEGGITRFLAVFYCGAASDNYTIGQIRSARVYFVDYASEYGKFPIFVHWGGANNIDNTSPSGIKARGTVDPRVDVYKVLDKIGWANGRYGNDMDGMSNTGYPALFVDDRRMDLATEHQKVGSIDKLYEEAAKREFTNKEANGDAWDKYYESWKFIDDDPEKTSPVSEISFGFWDNKPEYDVTWKYDVNTNTYLRFNGGKEHLDLENKKQLYSKNIAIIFAKEETSVDKEGHSYYTTTGKGDALVFQNGKVIKGTWSKPTRTDRTSFLDDKGKEISFVRGKIWVEIVAIGNTVSY